ncbi:uncharacterized protein LOC117508020 [Thalassophryne amazonica]|uniref:uncharacterized protein LOC117508020 n=1 Tax=Thalassophryne amazonica TaxID=390379 RepID=UPI001471DE85|nr:uncharacterized protein LOC117508020 [Thalassophryne amazonica]
MAVRPHRRWSADIRPDFSELLNQLLTLSDSFITQFDENEQRMKEIETELQDAYSYQDSGVFKHAVAGWSLIAGIVVMAAAAVGVMARAGLTTATTVKMTTGLPQPLTVTAPVAKRMTASDVGAGGMATAGMATAGVMAAATAGIMLVGGALIFKVLKTRAQNQKREKLREQGEEFMKIVEPMNSWLEQLKNQSKKLEELVAEGQADQSVSGTEEFQELLQHMSRLSDDDATTAIQEMMLFLDNIDEENLQQSADQCMTTLDKLRKTKDVLKDLQGMSLQPKISMM